MTRAITFNITLEEAALLAAPGGDPNTSPLWPTSPAELFAGRWWPPICATGAAARSNPSATCSSNGRTRYLNAYPRLTARALPTPRTWAVQKDGAAAQTTITPG